MKFKNNNIELWTTVEGLAGIEECRPKPASKFIPQWWKDMPYLNEPKVVRNVKVCPSFPDMFSQGFIIPAWCDMIFEGGENPGFTLPHEDFKMSFHTHKQFLDYVPDNYRKTVNAIIKAHMPWRIKTPKGYSVYQMPLFFHYNEDFSIMPGIIDTDKHHIANPQIVLHTEKTKVVVKRGDPFVWYIPFKREKLSIEVREETEEDRYVDVVHHLNIFSKFTDGYKKGMGNG
jgi:hypothetical protein